MFRKLVPICYAIPSALVWQGGALNKGGIVRRHASVQCTLGDYVESGNHLTAAKIVSTFALCTVATGVHGLRSLGQTCAVSPIQSATYLATVQPTSPPAIRSATRRSVVRLFVKRGTQLRLIIGRSVARNLCLPASNKAGCDLPLPIRGYLYQWHCKNTLEAVNWWVLQKWRQINAWHRQACAVS